MMMEMPDSHFEISGCEVCPLCGGCPEDYYVYKDASIIAYMRLRHGYFTVECPDSGGERVFEARLAGDMPDMQGIFADEEREGYLTKGVAAALLWLERNS